METSAAINNPTEWELPQRQSPAAIFIILWSTVLKLLKGFWPLLALYFFKKETDGNSLSLLGMLVAFSALSVIAAIINFWFKKFYISGDNLIIKTGWLKKKTTSIPFRNIQAVHLEQNVWQQALDVAKVSFDATGSEKVEVQLDALTTEKAEALKELLMNRAKDPIAFKADEVVPQNNAYKLSFSDLIKLSLTANHLEAFLILMAVGFNLLEEIEKIFDFNGQNYLHAYVQEVFSQTIFAATFLFFGVAVVSVLFSAIRTIIKFYGFTLTDTRKDWKITFGLFNREQKTIPINKIQILSWRATWLRRKFDYWIMHIQAVGQNRKQYVQVPIIAFSQLQQLSQSYQEFRGIHPTESNKIAPAYWKRKALLLGLPFTLIPMAVSFYFIAWWSLLFILLFVYLVAYYYKSYQNFRWQTIDGGFQMQSGAWGRKFTLLNWKKVQQVHVYQSPYQRRHQLATVLFLTAGGKVRLPFLSLSTASTLADHVLYDVESKDEEWM